MKENVELGEYIRLYAEKFNSRYIYFLEMGVPVYVSIDSKRFSRVLDNVIGNIIRYNPEGTPIHISISLRKNSVLLKVRDEGEGMFPEVLENLFDQYYRGTNTTSDDSGTGLGLTIAKQLVEAHGAKMYVNSDKRGTTVIISLALVEDI